MDRHRLGSSKNEEARGRGVAKNKENPISDTVYLLQNENDVLRMKNEEVSLKIKELKIQLKICSDNIAMHEAELESLRSRIRSNTYKEDIEIENEKKLILEKLALLKTSEESILRKIAETREATIFQQEKIANIQSDRKTLQMEILSMRAQNQGTKIILRNLQQENQRLREENQKLVSKRKTNQPRERQISLQIQERIRLIKSQQQNLKHLRVYETAKLINNLLSTLFAKKLKGYFTSIDYYGSTRKFLKKKIFQLSLIRKKYILAVKGRILQKLGEGFKPLVQQETARRIISQTHLRRVKASVWMKWRKASVQSQCRTMRQFQVQNLFTKLGQSFDKCNLFSSFNMIKNFKNNPLKQRSVILIESIFSNFMRRSKYTFFSCLKTAQNSHQMNLQIQASSKQQSTMLITSLYFSAWAKLTKSKRIQNKSIKRRYFFELKKLLALKGRRVLGQMLLATNQRINNVAIQSKIFTTLKKDALLTRIEDLNGEKKVFIQKITNLDEQMTELRSAKKQLYQELSLIKISKYLKTKMQKAFDIWRLRKQQSKVILTIMNLIQSKKAFDKNFAFSKILKKRFFMLKKSIRDKIASCQFSYNYLLDQNKHIKQVLDKKQHELQKTKFVAIIKRIIKGEKEIKLKYFYKFLKNGFKYWKFRKTIDRMEKMVAKKVKIVFLWILKQQAAQIHAQAKMDHFLEEKQKKISSKLLKNSLKGFKLNIEKNRRIRRVMSGIFNRNLELDSFVAFGVIRNIEHLEARSQIKSDIDNIKTEIDNRNAVAASEQELTKILVNRLQDKQQTLQQRKVLGLFMFFSKNVVKKVSSYIQKWSKKVKREKNVSSFAQILERKTRILLKNKFLLSINKKNQDYTVGQLQDKLQKYQGQYDHMAHNLQQYIQTSEKESARMKSQNQTNKKQGEYLQKKTDFMTNIKLKSFKNAWNKKLICFVFKYWRQQTDIFIRDWSDLDKKFSTRIKKESFDIFTKELKFMLQNDRLRANLSRIYHESYLHNAGLGFRVWRLVYLNKKNQIWTQEQQRQMKRFEGLEGKYKYAVNKHNKQVDFRLYDATNRSVFNQWRKYSERRKKNKVRGDIVNSYLDRCYRSEFLRILKNRVAKKILFKQKLNQYKEKWKIIRMKAFFTQGRSITTRRNTINKLFVNKLSPFLMNKVCQQFFTRMKNYINYTAKIKISDQTSKIQKLIQTFEKKRKSILNFNLRRWLRHQYLMRIQFNILKRVTRNAMNWRVKDLFYSWKLQSQAKKVKIMHEQQGQVKKRKIQIKRLKTFLQDFKKQKGLLLEDDGGQLVVSPRFQQKKQQQVKRDNNFRYKFISRLILSMNGYSAPIKAYNNLRMYMLVREKYRKHAKTTRNNLRKPELAYAFKIWHKATIDFNKMFETMERKALIKILNRQKDKMQMEYSKKASLQQKILDQMKVHKILSYQEDRKEKLSAHVFLKNMRKVQLFALLTWKKRVSQAKQEEIYQLQDQGVGKINSLEEQVIQLQQLERQLRDNNNKLEMAVREALQIAEMVKRITEQRDTLSNMITQKLLTCESLQEENEDLNAKLYLAQKQAMNLLILSGERL